MENSLKLLTIHNQYLKYSLIGIIILVIISLILTIWLPFIQSFRIVFGAVYLLFLPGFVWSWVFWKKGELDSIERFTLSLALSIAIVPLVVFFLNKVGVKINLVNSLIEISGIIIVAVIILTIKKFSLIEDGKRFIKT